MKQKFIRVGALCVQILGLMRFLFAKARPNPTPWQPRDEPVPNVFDGFHPDPVAVELGCTTPRTPRL